MEEEETPLQLLEDKLDELHDLVSSGKDTEYMVKKSELEPLINALDEELLDNEANSKELKEGVVVLRDKVEELEAAVETAECNKCILCRLLKN